MAKKIKVIKYVSKPRNRVAQNPLLKKGGVHQQTFKAQRKQDRQTLCNALKHQKIPLQSRDFFWLFKKYFGLRLA
jgi:hypothetical protein